MLLFGETVSMCASQTLRIEPLVGTRFVCLPVDSESVNPLPAHASQPHINMFFFFFLLALNVKMHGTSSTHCAQSRRDGINLSSSPSCSEAERVVVRLQGYGIPFTPARWNNAEWLKRGEIKCFKGCDPDMNPPLY